VTVDPLEPRTAQRVKQEPASETILDEEIWSEEQLAVALEPTPNPLASIGRWVKDIALFGAGAGSLVGLNAALINVGGPFDWATNLLIGTAIGIPIMALEGAMSGLAAGAVLKLLRGRVPAALGLGLASIAAAVGASAWMFLDLDINLAHWLTWTPIWALGVACMIPVTAVRRVQNRATVGWILKAGFATGILMTIARFVRMAIF
jgi:hypothetical protein